jgi:hypothetical protein
MFQSSYHVVYLALVLSLNNKQNFVTIRTENWRWIRPFSLFTCCMFSNLMGSVGFIFRQHLGNECYYSSRLIYTVFHTSSSLLSPSSYPTSSYSLNPSRISSTVWALTKWHMLWFRFENFTDFTVHNTSRVTFSPLTLPFFYSDVIKSSVRVAYTPPPTKAVLRSGTKL